MLRIRIHTHIYTYKYYMSISIASQAQHGVLCVCFQPVYSDFNHLRSFPRSHIVRTHTAEVFASFGGFYDNIHRFFRLHITHNTFTVWMGLQHSQGADTTVTSTSSALHNNTSNIIRYIFKFCYNWHQGISPQSLNNVMSILLHIAYHSWCSSIILYVYYIYFRCYDHPQSR